MIVLFSLPLAEVDFDQSILYSTIILAILLTGKKRTGKFLATLWEMARWQAWSRITTINRRQFMFQGLGWGIPLTQIKKLLSVRNVVRKRSSIRKKRGHKHVNRTVVSAGLPNFRGLENSTNSFSVRKGDPKWPQIIINHLYYLI